MDAHTDLVPILAILLNAVARECRTTQEHLTLEIEQTAMKALMAAYEKGFEAAHDRPTIPDIPNPNPSPIRRAPRGSF